MTFAPTAEQVHIHELFRTGQTVKVRAGAGTGKTTTLGQLAEILQEQNRIGLYVAFNKSIAVEAARKFPNNVSASTAHSLAYKGIRTGPRGNLLAKMGSGRIPFYLTEQRLGIREIRTQGGDGHPRTLTGYQVTRHVLRTIDEFCKTADQTITAAHVPPVLGVEGAGAATLAEAVASYARKGWRDICDPSGDAIPFGHSHYLKLWALDRPKFGPNGAALFLDEAQDTSPVLAGVIADQDHLQRVYVGDSAQAIYRFTGAVDAMKNLDAAAEGRLSQSWRFGSEVADAANYMLDQLGDDMRLSGNPGLDSVISRTPQAWNATLTRSNGRAIEHVMAAQRAGKKTHLMGDNRYALQFCDSAEKLMDGKSAGYGDLAAFDSWADVVEHAEHSPDASDWKVLAGLIEKHGVPALRNSLGSVVDERRAEVIVATAHKSKGREWGKVFLDDDLAASIEDKAEGEDTDALRDEQMLAYVAITRAQHVLHPGRLVPTPDSVQAVAA